MSQFTKFYPFIKYSILFFIILFIGKIAYLFGENFINSALIDLSIKQKMNSEEIKIFQGNMQFLSAFGFTIITYPFWYKLISRRIKNIGSKLFIIFFFLGISFLSFKSFIDETVEYFVNQYQSEYYNAYNMSLLRYGIVTDTITFKDFINKEHIDDFSVSDKTLLLNMMILSFTHTDKEIEDITESMKPQIVNAIYNNDGSKNFNKLQSSVNQIAKSVEENWNNYVEAIENANQKYLKAQDVEYVKDVYNKILKKMDKMISDKYNEYLKKVASFNKRINQDLKRAPAISKKLSKYFNIKPKYQNRYRYKYDNACKDMIGKVIPPGEFCHIGNGNMYISSTCGDVLAVSNYIKREYQKEWEKRSSIPKDLKFEEFVEQKEIKNKINNSIDTYLNREFGLNYETFEFDTFYKSYQKKIAKEINLKFREKVGSILKKGAPIDSLEFNDFSSNEILYPKLKSAGISESDIGIIISLIQKEDMSTLYNFYEKKKSRQITSTIIKTGNALKDYKNASKEDIRIGETLFISIYIAPVILAVTLILSIINVIAIVYMILSFIFYKTSRHITLLQKKSLSTMYNFSYILLVFYLSVYIITTPNKKFIENNDFISYFYNEKGSLSNKKYYINILSWVVEFEKYSYTIGKRVKNASSEKEVIKIISIPKKEILVTVDACNIRDRKGAKIGMFYKNKKVKWTTKEGKRYQIGVNHFIHETCVKELK